MTKKPHISEFRFQCEVVLSKSLSEALLLCWRVLKAYKKAYIGREPKVLAYYLWKNVVFWLFEAIGPEVWTDDTLLESVCKALDLMILFL